MKKLLSKMLTRLSKSLEITMPSRIPPTKNKGRSWPLWLFLGGVTFSLEESFKIVQREMYKAHMELRRECLEMDPRKLNTVENVDKLGFERVVCKGVYDKQRSIYVGPKPRSMAQGSENGFYVITPLLPIPNEPNSMKSPILVNRGWVPLDWEEKSVECIQADDVLVATANKDESIRAKKLLSSQLNPLSKFLYKFNNSMIAEQEKVSKAMHVEVVGVVRKSETPGIFYSLAHYPGSLAWFFLDVPKLAQTMGFGEDTIYVEKTHRDMDESRPYPSPRHVEDLIKSKKLPLELVDYIVLWSLISLACFMKWSTCIVQRYGKCEPGGLKLIHSLFLFVAYIKWKVYSHRDLFYVIDTIGVGCVTNLDPRQQDGVKGSIDWDGEEIDERTWTLYSFI
ncbi:LOW QUALITY PROTEIN: surfeit locus protein 1-like [Raphanus sativus]|uniref:SURF1-like protein n=1 Tax=Raphanus sativus TaxID=3726 RepID=A0A9W3BX76_RAPSA|nr:LOW QUALITY PROTEIN: surfeit locus protein 1-like [Raphanus sativus]